jgi:ATP-dependent helicase STH1/SNF2
MYDRLLSITRSIIYLKEKGTKRKLSDIFLEKPCPQTYADYYQLIDKPIGMNDILRKCRAKLYSSANDFLDDWNTLFKNAITYNGEGSWIVNDAEVIRGELDRLMEKNALSAMEINDLGAMEKHAFSASVAESKKPVRIKLSLKMGKKKGPTGNGVTTPVVAVDSDDESDSDSESDDNSGVVSVINQEAIKQEARCPKKRKRPTS